MNNIYCCKIFCGNVSPLKGIKLIKKFIALNFIFRQNPSPAYPFVFDSALTELTSSGVIVDELLVNDLTLEKLQHKYVVLFLF